MMITIMIIIVIIIIIIMMIIIIMIIIVMMMIIPIEVTLLGMVTAAREVHWEKADSPNDSNDVVMMMVGNWDWW